MKKAVFLDRDGVINEDFGYVFRIEDFKFRAEIFDFLKEISLLDYEIFVITNQSGIGRNFYSLKDFEILNNFMLNEFKKHGIFIKKVYFCPHSPDENCECRKPKAGMILKAFKEFNINLENSVLIGDKMSDIKSGINVNIKNLFLLSGQNLKINIEILNKISARNFKLKIVKKLMDILKEIK